MKSLSSVVPPKLPKKKLSERVLGGALDVSTEITTTEDIVELAHLISETKTLKVLKLNDNYLTEKQVEIILIALETNATLTELHLLNNRLSVEGKKKIADFQKSVKNKSKCIIKLDAEEPKNIISADAEPSSQKKMRTDSAGKSASLTAFHLAALESLPAFPELSGFPDLSNTVSDPFDIRGLPSFPNSGFMGFSGFTHSASSSGALASLDFSKSSSADNTSGLPNFSNPLSLAGFKSLDDDCLPGLEYDFSTWKDASATMSTDHTLADGNCAFNAVTLGICHLLKNNDMKLSAELQATFAAKFPTEIKQFGEVSAWLKQEQDTAKLQKILSPLFRNLAVFYIQKNYALFSETYEQGLKSAFTHYACLGEKEETYCVHPHIIAKFEALKKQQDDLIKNCKSEVERRQVIAQIEATLIKWWNASDANAKSQNEGIHQYYANIQKSAEGASDLRTWGSEVEIDAIAKFFGITIKNKKMGARTQILGCGFGIVNNLSQDEILHLDALSLGSVFANNFRIEADYKTLRETLRWQRLSETEIKFLDEQGRKEILDYINLRKNPSRPMHSNNFLPDICQKLEKIGGLAYKNVNANGLSLMDFVAPKRLAHLIKPIPEALIQKVLGAYKNDISSFEITHLGAHWIYTPAPEVAKSAAAGSAGQSATAIAALPAAVSTASAKRKFG